MIPPDPRRAQTARASVSPPQKNTMILSYLEGIWARAVGWAGIGLRLYRH